jgi:hypothetical protein
MVPPVGRIARRLDLARLLRASALEGQDEDDLRVPARSMMSRHAHKTYSAGADAARIIAVAFAPRSMTLPPLNSVATSDSLL